MICTKVLKTWTYSYKDKEEKKVHKACMLTAKFKIEEEKELEVTYSQTIS